MSNDSRLNLSDVTLVVIDDVSGDLATLAIRDTVKQVLFADIVRIYNLRESTYEEVLWYKLHTQIQTSHFLVVQYDGWVRDASLWQPHWLEYDYIGAPWPWHRDRRVGNGGFSLRSTKLAKFLADNRDVFPVRSPEDDTLCRTYRRALESHGFRWAPQEVADDFSFERAPPRPTFGFHGLFNFPHVLDKDALVERIALANSYVRSKPEWKELWAGSREILVQ